jgi:hypothetical protein
MTQRTAGWIDDLTRAVQEFETARARVGGAGGSWIMTFRRLEILVHAHPICARRILDRMDERSRTGAA